VPALKVVEVIWEDACSSDPWSRSKDQLEPCICITVGIQLSRDKKGIFLCAAMNDGGQRSSRWRIPAGMIRKVRTLGTITKLTGIE
jgi:hypothetical protein